MRPRAIRKRAATASADLAPLRAGTAMMFGPAGGLHVRGPTQTEEDAMRKVVAYELLSLDGVAEHPDEFVTEFDEVMRDNLGRVIATQDAVLLGRRTYDDWAEFWPPVSMSHLRASSTASTSSW
jgi:hypothetical protein